MSASTCLRWEARAFRSTMPHGMGGPARRSAMSGAALPRRYSSRMERDRKQLWPEPAVSATSPPDTLG